MRERLREEMQKGTLLIDTDGERVGQVNGLSVLQLGGYMFGMPSRITARVRLGSGGVIDIEREAELGGPLHSKGVLILSGFLAGRYSADQPLSLSATLVFEQNYGGVEGDSASCAELYALLSALADAPIRQSLAVTGSVNQHGDVQAIGGVNEKIEGFFDLCRARGLTGRQGVIIPAANVRHLMLRHDVVEAVAAGLLRRLPGRDGRPGRGDPRRRSRGRARRVGPLSGRHRQRPRRAASRGVRRPGALLLRRPAGQARLAARQAQVKIRRIVVGLDTAAHSRSALVAAAALAGELGAELEALFVESEELHGLARLPFAREMGFPSAAMRPLDTAALERTLDVHAREARRALTALAERRSLRWSFRVARGSVPGELLAASGNADLTVVGVARWGPGDLRLARDAPTTLLVLPQSGRFRGHLAAICPVAVSPEHAIGLVASLAAAVGDGFTILVVSDDLAVAAAWCEKAGELLRREGSSRRARDRPRRPARGPAGGPGAPGPTRRGDHRPAPGGDSQ